MFLTIVVALVLIYLVFDWLIRLLKVGNFSNKYVLITGCDTGFGRQLAIRLDKMGFPVFAGCLTEEGRRSLQDACSRQVVGLILDITDSESIKTAFDIVTRALPSDNALWAVVNNSGITGPICSAEICSMKDYLHTCQVNLFGHIEVTQVFMPLLRKSCGRVVTTTSVMGRISAAAAPYCVSKYGLEAFCDLLRNDVAKFGVKVSIIEPGYFKTSMVTNKERLKKFALDTFRQASPEAQAAYGGDAYIENVCLLAESLENMSSPDTSKVVDAYVSAITSAYPRPRYTVGYDAKFIFVPLSHMPEWITDRVLATMKKRLFKKVKEINAKLD